MKLPAIEGLSEEEARVAFRQLTYQIMQLASSFGLDVHNLIIGMKMAAGYRDVTQNQLEQMIDVIATSVDEHGPIGLNLFVTDIPMEVMKAFGASVWAKVQSGEPIVDTLKDAASSIGTLRKIYDGNTAG